VPDLVAALAAARPHPGQSVRAEIPLKNGEKTTGLIYTYICFNHV
jgi:hypothetical protein